MDDAHAQSVDESPDDKHDDFVTEHEDPRELIDKLLEGRQYTEQFVFESDEGSIILHLKPIYDRQARYDYLSKLPSGWFEAGEKDSVDDVDDFKSLIPDGDGIGALEDMVIDVATHPVLAPVEIEDVVRKLASDEVVTQAGLKVVQMSGDVHTVDGFRQR